MTEIETKWTLETWDLGQHKHRVVQQGEVLSSTLGAEQPGVAAEVGDQLVEQQHCYEGFKSQQWMPECVLMLYSTQTTSWAHCDGHLKHCTLFWVSRFKRLAEKGEESQQRTARIVKGLIHTSPWVLRRLGWFRLVNRRLMADLIATYSYQKDTKMREPNAW